MLCNDHNDHYDYHYRAIIQPFHIPEIYVSGAEDVSDDLLVRAAVVGVPVEVSDWVPRLYPADELPRLARRALDSATVSSPQRLPWTQTSGDNPAIHTNVM